MSVADATVQMDFVAMEGAGEVVDLHGDMRSVKDAALPPMARPSSGTGGNMASRFLANQGYGWLMELEDDAEENQPPLLEELDIDLKDIFYKVRCVLLPIPALGFQRQIVRDSPDFWGPLLVVLAYALLSLYGQMRVVSWILTVWFLGSFLVYVLVRVLGGNNSFAQTLGVLGYSLLPLIITAALLPLVAGVRVLTLAVRGAGIVWAALSAGSLLVTDDLQHKRVLVLYPIFILFVYFFSLYDGA